MIGGSDFTDLYVEDNGTDVTSSLVYVPEQTSGNETHPAYYYYYVSNVSANHTVTVYLGAPTPSTYTVSGTATDGLTLSADYTLNNQSLYDDLPITADTGSTVTVYIDGSDFTGFTLLDNNVDVTAQCDYSQPSQNFPAGFYAYIITNIQSAHILTATISSATMPIRVKRNGTWVTAQKVLVKQNGSWVIGTVKVKDSGTWK